MSPETDRNDLMETSEDVQRCVSFLENNPYEIPTTLVNRLIRLKITDWCNKGAEGQLEAREYFDKNPEEAWLMHFALTQYL